MGLIDIALSFKPQKEKQINAKKMWEELFDLSF